jgi:hypothetical protein
MAAPAAIEVDHKNQNYRSAKIALQSVPRSLLCHLLLSTPTHAGRHPELQKDV